MKAHHVDFSLTLAIIEENFSNFLHPFPHTKFETKSLNHIIVSLKAFI